MSRRNRRKSTSESAAAAPRADRAASAAPAPPGHRTRVAGCWPARRCCFVARPFVLSDGSPWAGDGQPFAILWIVLALLWVLGAIGRPQFSLRATWLDLAAIAFFGWWILSCIHALDTGAPRPTVNMLWEGFAMLTMLLMLRQLAPSGRQSRAMIAVMLGVAVAMAGIALHQYFVSMPADRAEFKIDPARMLREAGLDPAERGSAEFKLFEDRLNSPGPFGMFALTNSLGAFLAPWLVAAMGIGLFGATLDISRRRLAIGSIAAESCRSRAGIASTHAQPQRVDRHVDRRGGNRIHGDAVSLSGSPACAAASVVDDRRGRSRLSLDRGDRIGNQPAGDFEARDQIVRLPSGVLASDARDDSRPRGLGLRPGKFSGVLLPLYKLPISSEEIRDPHNFLFEIAANAGLPAAIAFLVLLGGFFRRMFRGPAAGPAEKSAARAQAEKPAAEPDLLGWIFGGGIAGIGLAIVLNIIFGFVARIPGTFAGAIAAGGVVWLLLPWIRAGELPRIVYSVGVGVLLIALLGVGGIAFGGVVGTLWLLVALGMNATDGPRAVKSAPQFVGWLLFAFLVMAGIAQYLSGYQPVMGCLRALGNVEIAAEEPSSDKTAARIEAQLAAATAADRWAIEPYQLLAGRRLAEWKATSDPSKRNWRLLDEFEDLTKTMLAVDRNSSSLWLEAGQNWLQIFRDLPKQAKYGVYAVHCCHRHLYRRICNTRTAASPNAVVLGRRTGHDRGRRPCPRSRPPGFQPRRPICHADKKLTAEQRAALTRIISGDKPR